MLNQTWGDRLNVRCFPNPVETCLTKKDKPAVYLPNNGEGG
jgi:hypothetical protein